MTYPLFLGLALGVRHAADPDHVATIAAVVLGRTSLPGALRTAALWGLGHSLTFLAVSLGIVLFGLRVPDAFETAVELAIASTLLGLGVATLLRARGDRSTQRGAGQPASEARAPRTARSVALGCMHGLAGSAGIALVALSTLHARADALLYLVVFSVGTVLGMAAITVVLVWSFRRTASAAWAQRALLVAAAAGSCLVGLTILAELVHRG